MLADIIISILCYINPSSYITHFMLDVVYYVTYTHSSYIAPFILVYHHAFAGII